jgi:hypothetical protein
MSKALVSIHPHGEFVPEEYRDNWNELNDIFEESYVLKQEGKDTVIEYNGQEYKDPTGKGKIPQDLLDELEEAEEIILTGGKASQCLPKAAIKIKDEYPKKTIIAESSSVYEPNGDSGFKELNEFQDDVPSRFSDAGFDKITSYLEN